MALIECPDCGKQVSDAASTCIGCGRPLRGVAASPAPTGTQEAPMLIEQSSKKYKRGMLIGLAAIPIALFLMFVASNAVSPGAAQGLLVTAALVALAGLGWFLVNFVARWWHHA